MISHVENIDCMAFMARYPDKHFELAIVDTPYGININHNIGRRKGDHHSKYAPATWDSSAPPPQYFEELMRVSENQIIWGANHFISRMPIVSPCWILWDKGFSEKVTFAQFELAWASFNSSCKKFNMSSADPANRIHPTQKPIALYKWLLTKYAKPGDKILDTHLGSGSSRIAAHDLGFDFYATELDADYFQASCKRFDQYTSQQTLFQPEEVRQYKQEKLI